MEFQVNGQFLEKRMVRIDLCQQLRHVAVEECNIKPRRRIANTGYQDVDSIVESWDCAESLVTGPMVLRRAKRS
jgi:hypothetical protein